jgi:uncharacterized membrane-anchored protein
MKHSSQNIVGPLFFGSKTKDLVRKLPYGSLVLIDHEDIDEMAAVSLIDKKVKAVLNRAQSMTGRYPGIGTKMLIEAHIPVYDIKNEIKLDQVSQGELIRIKDNRMFFCMGSRSKTEITHEHACLLSQYNNQVIQEQLQKAELNMTSSLKSFTENTLRFASKEMHEILKPIQLPPLKASLRNRHVLVVTRGKGYLEDLRALRRYILEKKPVLIGVDGGADAIIQCGFKPDIIIGDMDSVSEAALRSGAEIIVHAYSSTDAPGMKIINQLGLSAQIFPCFGTSEDAAHLLAFEAGALLIVTLGSHTNMIDFLEKGRKGMGSTLLVRLKIGEKLLDAKGVSLLYSDYQKSSYLTKLRTFLGLL